MVCAKPFIAAFTVIHRVLTIGAKLSFITYFTINNLENARGRPVAAESATFCTGLDSHTVLTVTLVAKITFTLVVVNAIIAKETIMPIAHVRRMHEAISAHGGIAAPAETEIRVKLTINTRRFTTCITKASFATSRTAYFAATATLVHFTTLETVCILAIATDFNVGGTVGPPTKALITTDTIQGRRSTFIRNDLHTLLYKRFFAFTAQ